MKFINPKTEILSVTHEGIEYTKEYYKPFINATNLDDEAYPDWDVATTYNLNDYCILPELKRIYKSTSETNIGNFPAINESTDWVDFGAVNSFKMFEMDENIGATTNGVDSLLEFNFNACNSFSGLDLEFVSADAMHINTYNINYLSDYSSATSYVVNDGVVFNNDFYVAVRDSIGSEPSVINIDWELRNDLVLFNQKIYGVDIGCSTYGEYFYTGQTKISRKVITDLVWLPTSILRIKLNEAYKFGTICYNDLEDFGATLIESKLKLQSSSKISTDTFTGFRTINRYGQVRVLDVSVIFKGELFGQVAQTASNVIDKNIVWIPDATDKFSESILLGYIEDFEMPMNNSQLFETTATIIGVSK